MTFETVALFFLILILGGASLYFARAFFKRGEQVRRLENTIQQFKECFPQEIADEVLRRLTRERAEALRAAGVEGGLDMPMIFPATSEKSEEYLKRFGPVLAITEKRRKIAGILWFLGYNTAMPKVVDLPDPSQN